MFSYLFFVFFVFLSLKKVWQLRAAAITCQIPPLHLLYFQYLYALKWVKSEIPVNCQILWTSYWPQLLLVCGSFCCFDFKKERNIWIIPFIYLEMCLSCFHCVHHSWCGVWWSVIGFPSLMCLLVHFSFIYKFVVYECKQRFSYWGKLFEYCWRSLLSLTLTVKLVFWTWSHPIFQLFWWCETLPLKDLLIFVSHSLSFSYSAPSLL